MDSTTKPPKESEESDEDRFSIGKFPTYDDWVEEYLKKTNISGRCRCDGPTYCPWCGK